MVDSDEVLAMCPENMVCMSISPNDFMKDLTEKNSIKSNWVKYKVKDRIF